jgi:hypothetical protein
VFERPTDQDRCERAHGRQHQQRNRRGGVPVIDLIAWLILAAPGALIWLLRLLELDSGVLKPIHL